MVVVPALGQEIDLTPAQQEWLAAHPTVRLGPYSNYPPAQFVDANGEHQGIAAEYVAIIEQMVPIKFINVYTENWQEILDKAKAREIDVIALAAETEERKTYLLFTSAYLDLPAVIIARDTVDEQLTVPDLEGMRVGVVEGYAVHDYLKETYPDLELDVSPDTRTGLRKVSFGILDAFISDLAVSSYYIDEQGITNLRVVGDSGYVYHMGFASRNDWPLLRSILESALGQIPPETRTAIANRWISLSHETEFASRRFTKFLLGAVAGIALAVVGVLVWIRLLQRQVGLRTAALQHSEQRTRSIISTALDAVITMDARGNVTGWSEQAERAFGWSRAEALERPLAELIIPEPHRRPHQEGLKKFLETGEGPVLNKRIEISGLHKDGHEIPVELAIAPILRDGEYEFCAFVRDISERTRAEAELHQHRNRLEELVVERTADLHAAKETLAARVTELETALAEVKQLRGLLPICSYCHRIREGEEFTRSVEAYLAEHSDARFSHGVCPDCYEKHVRPRIEEL